MYSSYNYCKCDQVLHVQRLDQMEPFHILLDQMGLDQMGSDKVGILPTHLLGLSKPDLQPARLVVSAVGT